MRIPSEDWLTLVVDLVLIMTGLVAVSLLPAMALRAWRIQIAAAHSTVFP